MKTYPKYVCHNLAEVQKATENLNKAKMVPIQIEDGSIIKKVENWKGVYNISQGKLCSVVVPFYNLVQHKEYIDNFAVALDKLGLKYKMKIKAQGNRVFADVEFEGRNLKFEKLNEEFTTGIRIVNSYDKTAGVSMVPRFTRLACTNGMILTRNEKMLSIKHHQKILKEITSFVEKRLNNIINTYGDLQNWVSVSMKDSIEWKVTCKIIEKLFEQLKHREEVLKRLNLSVIEVTDKKTKKKSVTYVWNDEKKKKIKFTRWEIYNAITDYLTHNEQITPHIESLFQKRAEKVLMTPLVELPVAKGDILG